MADMALTPDSLRRGDEHPGPDSPALVAGIGNVIDLEAAERAVAQLLRALGQDVTSEHLAQTPRRVAAAYAELLTPAPFVMTTFPNDERYDEVVLARDIPFQSLCEHHMMPFHGVAHVGYLPDRRIIGLSKLARVVDAYARGFQVQERLTKQVAEALQSQLAPKAVGVVMVAEHQCMSSRGVRARGSRTATSSLQGLFLTDASARREFLDLTRR